MHQTDSPIVSSVATIPSREGHKLSAIVTRPRQSAGAHTTIIFCQTGLLCKTSVGDYARWLADQLACHGFVVVRFDQSGTGDSQGVHGMGVSANAFFRKIQTGVFVNDTLDVVDWARSELAAEDIALWGQCGGGVTALLACAAQPEAISSLILVSVPVLYTAVKERGLREFDGSMVRAGYLKKLRQPQSYLRLLLGRSDYRLILSSLQTALRVGYRKVHDTITRLKTAAVPDHPGFNWHFWEAFKMVMHHDISIFFLMAAMDNETPDFNHEFRSKVLDKTERYTSFCRVEYVDQADHSFIFPSGRQRSLDAVLRWLQP